jgi:serine/threonine protein kinase
MLKKNSKKEKNKNKRVHFNLEQINESHKKERPKSADKKKLKNNINNEGTSVEKATSIEDFNIIQELGSGSCSKILLAQHKKNGNKYAIKTLNKNELNNNEKLYEVYVERQCLSELKHPNIVRLSRLFQDKKSLYLALEYCKNQDLGKLLNILGKLDYKLAKFYAAELLSAISYMHKHGIYHRNLNPANIGLDESMHLKVFDFATSVKTKQYFDLASMRFVEFDEDELAYLNKYINKVNANTIKINQYNIILLNHLIVESPEYTPPEVLEHDYSKIGKGVDIWAFGIMLYLFFTGTTPFKAKKESKMFDNIKNAKYSFDDKENKIPDVVKDLISKILVKDPTKRIGYKSKDYFEIKNHPFFQDVYFENLEFDDPPLSEVREKLTKLGYSIPKSSIEDEYNEMNNANENKNENSDSEREIMKCNTAKNFGEFDRKKKSKSVDPDDTVLLEAKLKKKSPWVHYNTRIVKFFSKGHIDYYDPETNELKGSFDINSHCRVVAIDDYKFEIITVNRSYLFKHKSQKIAKIWESTLNTFISNCSENENSF